MKKIFLTLLLGLFFISTIHSQSFHKYFEKSGSIRYILSSYKMAKPLKTKKQPHSRIEVKVLFDDFGATELLTWEIPTGQNFTFLKIDSLEYQFENDSCILVQPRTFHFDFERIIFNYDNHQKDILVSTNLIVEKEFLGFDAEFYYHFWFSPIGYPHDRLGTVIHYKGVPLKSLYRKQLNGELKIAYAIEADAFSIHSPSERLNLFKNKAYEFRNKK